MSDKILIRDVLLQRVLTKYSRIDRSILDMLYDASEHWDHLSQLKTVQRIGFKDNPITPELIIFVSILLRYRYAKLEDSVIKDIEEMNREITNGCSGKSYKKVRGGNVQSIF